MAKNNKNNHENTKTEKHENYHGLFRVFVLSRFRDKIFFFFPFQFIQIGISCFGFKLWTTRKTCQ